MKYSYDFAVIVGVKSKSVSKPVHTYYLDGFNCKRVAAIQLASITERKALRCHFCDHFSITSHVS